VWIAGNEIRLVRLEEGLRLVDVFGGPGPYLGVSAAAAASLGGPGLLAAAGNQLTIVDTTSGSDGPLNPRVLSRLPALWPMLAIAAAGDHALVAKGLGGLDIVAMEGIPEVAISYVPSAGVYGVITRGAAAYLSTGEGAQVLDVSVPHEPGLGATFGPAWPPTSWLAAGTTTVVGAYVDSIRVADTSSGTPVDAGMLNLADVPDWPAGAVVQGVTAVGNVAYLASGSAGVVVVDVLDPTRPRLGRRLGVDAPVTGVAASGRWLGAVTADGWALFDATQPLFPELVERVKTAPAYAIAFDGDSMWVADEEGVRERDLADPGRPERRFTAARPGRAVVVTARGALAEVGSVLNSLERVELAEATATPTASAVPTGWPSPAEATDTPSPTREPTPTEEPDRTRYVYLPWSSASRP
jgi:hypothetical protein